MTTVSYEWINKITGETRVTKSLIEAKDWVETEGGEYRQILQENLSQSEGYCMDGAAHASDRWKNYKF